MKNGFERLVYLAIIFVAPILLSCSSGMSAGLQAASASASRFVDVFAINYEGNPIPFRGEIVDGHVIVEGDIDLGPLEAVQAKGRWLSLGVSPKSTLIGPSEGQPWPTWQVQYCRPNISNPERVFSAMRYIETKTPFRFVENTFLCNMPASVANPTPQVVPVDPALLIFFEGKGCYSPVGYQRGMGNRISLGLGCEFGQAVHEIAHSLGLWHEQSRNDRDQYIKVLTNNVEPERLSNFDIRPMARVVGPYDYSSIMHYGAYDFSKTGLPTIETIPPNQPIGQRSMLSSGDVAGFRALYPNFPW